MSGSAQQFIVGDVFYLHFDNQYHVYKLLHVEAACETYHILSYEPLQQPPDNNQIAGLEIQIYHSPVDSKAFAEAVLLTNNQITADDLIGYHEYLTQTQDPDYYIPIANDYYQAGLRLTDLHLHHEAIDEYTKAIDLLPQFFEAIDNRAFCKMDLGKWEEAIEDFTLSLEENPDSFLAEFSIGECYFKLKDYPQARARFEKAQQIDPADEATKLFLQKIDAEMK